MVIFGSDSGGNGKILTVVMMCEAGYQSNRVHPKPHKGIEIAEIPQKKSNLQPLQNPYDITKLSKSLHVH